MNRAYIRLASGYVVLIAAVFLILGIYLVRTVNEYQNDAWRDQVVSEARIGASAVQRAIDAGSGDAIDDLASGLDAGQSGSLTVIDSSGQVIAGNPSREDTDLLSASDIEAALRGEIGDTEVRNPETGATEYSVAVPVTDASGAEAVAVWSVPVDEAPGAWNSLTQLTVLVLTLCAIGIAAVSAFMPRIITQPLAELTAVARRVSRGDLDARANTETYDEVSELADAFNEMTDELRSQLLAIEYERARLEAIVEHLNDGILIVDPRGAVGLINHTAEQLLGVDRDRALVRTYAEVIRDHELVGLIRNSHRDYDPAKSLPSRFIELGRPRRSVQAFAYPISRGESELVIVILRDITELRRTETVRRDFVANVSHDLRTPIASLKALVETLLDGALEDQSVARDFLSRMEVEVDDLARLVEELLELSRAESRRIELHQIPADLGNLVRRAAARLRAHAEPRGVAFDIAVANDLPPGYFDPERIEQVLVNLLHNATKFTPQGESVRIEVVRDVDDLQVRVIDRGPGIPTEELERVFERFYKSDQSRSNSGSGLGLAIAKHLVQLHGGRIWAESEHRGGTTFAFTVPVATEAHANMFNDDYASRQS